MKTLIIGGARSGKSAHAERLAAAGDAPVSVIATARAWDAEMARRIDLHRRGRPAAWRTVEEPLALARALTRVATPDGVVLIDCLTLWLSNLMLADTEDEHPAGATACGSSAPFDSLDAFVPPAAFGRERAAFLQALEAAPGEVIVVSNELGWGVVPLGAANRWFVDEAGRLNQAVAQRCDRVLLVAAGLPLTLKG